MKSLKIFVAVLLSLAAASGPSAAASDTVWFKRAFNDILLRQPTTQEVASLLTFLANNSGLSTQTWRFSVAMFLLDQANGAHTPEWPDELVGADPFKPGFYQALLGISPGPGASAYYRCRFETGTPTWSDEQIIADIIGSILDDTCGGHLRGATYAVYRARALALNPGFAACTQSCGSAASTGAIIDQIYQDLLGRHATSGELSVVGTEQEAVAQVLAAILGAPGSGPASIEYIQRVVRSGFFRFLHRLPGELAGSSPDGVTSELDYFVALRHGDSAFNLLIHTNEAIDAYLVSSPEYDDQIMQTLPAYQSLSLQPVDLVVAGQSLEQFGAPPPIVSSVTSPIFLNGAIASSAGAVAVLTQQVAAQEQTITQLSVSNASQQQIISALAVDVFGGAMTKDAAQALIDEAAARLKQAESLLCPDLGGFPCTNQRVLRARGLLALARQALASGDYDEAGREARDAWKSADLAIRLNR